MMHIKINRQKLGLEDLVFGEGTVEQTRGGETVTITKVNAANLPYDGQQALKDIVDTDIHPVAQKLDEITRVKHNIYSVDTVAGNIAKVNTVAGSITNVNTVAEVKDNVTTVATNIKDVNSFANTYFGSLDTDPTSSTHPALSEGDLYFNTISNTMKNYTGSTWEDMKVGYSKTEADGRFINSSKQLGGFGINGYHTVYEGDLNDIVVNSIVHVNCASANVSNAPRPSHWIFVHTFMSSDYASNPYSSQLAVGMQDNEIYYRINLNGTWQGWRSFAHTDWPTFTGTVTAPTFTASTHLYMLGTGGAGTGVVLFKNLPTSDPAVDGRLWNDAGTLKVSAG